jgi:regulator of protease activity HflC (stomatin/prohibitin superfamily)
VLVALSSGCAGTVVEPGHRGLFFDPRSGGLQHDVLQPGYHRTGWYGRIDDFDVTYSTNKETIRTVSQEGLAMDLKLAVIYRPIISELYELDTEIGPNYYEEVIGPEFRSVARGVFARHSYLELQAKNEKIEDEIEAGIRRRVAGKHLEITSVTLEEIAYAPEISNAVRAKLVGEQESLKQKAALENEALKQKLELEHQAEQSKLKAEQALREKKTEQSLAEAQAQIDKVRAATDAETRVTKAKAEAQEVTLLAKAHAEERRAETVSITPLAVAMHAYDALGKLGGEGTTIMLGDWSKTPRFLFPNGGFSPYGINPYSNGGASPATPNASK